jgi:hypothetical protein
MDLGSGTGFKALVVYIKIEFYFLMDAPSSVLLRDKAQGNRYPATQVSCL